MEMAVLGPTHSPFNGQAAPRCQSAEDFPVGKWGSPLFAQK